MLHDTRTRRSGDLGDAHERQALVGSDVAEDEERALEDEVRSFRSSASIDSERDGHVGALMGNAAARLSHLDVHADDADEGVDADALGEGETGEKGLAGKAGIIIVSSFCTVG